jgi:hypothetical protein
MRWHNDPIHHESKYRCVIWEHATGDIHKMCGMIDGAHVREDRG